MTAPLGAMSKTRSGDEPAQPERAFRNLKRARTSINRVTNLHLFVERSPAAMPPAPERLTAPGAVLHLVEHGHDHRLIPGAVIAEPDLGRLSRR